EQAVVAARLLVADGVVLAGVAVAEQLAVRQRIEGERPRDLRVHRDRAGGQPAFPRRLGWHRRDRGLAEHLPEAFVVGEPEGPVPGDRPAEGDAELVAMERRRLIAA